MSPTRARSVLGTASIILSLFITYISLAASLFVLWMALKTGFYRYIIFLFTFLITSLIGYSSSKIKERIVQSHILKLEKLDEEVNILSNEIEKKRGEIKSLEGKLVRYSTLKDAAEALSAVLAIDDINNLILEHTSKTLGKEGRHLLFLVDMKKQELMLSASKDAPRVKAKEGDVFDRWVLKYRKPLIVEDITKDFRFSAEDIEEASAAFRSLIATPLLSENKVIGVLRTDSLNESSYSLDDLRLLDFISDLGAVAIQNARLYARTQELAIRDGLTDMFLRRYFLERFQEEIKRAARRKGYSLSFLILDIDHFKDYNDRYGHTAGDLVLKHLARRLSSLIDEGDILIRYGGEEIGLLLPGTDKIQAAKEAEVIRKQIEEEPFILRREKTHLTVSIGLSSYPQDGTLEEELIRIADERLYKAKAEGRNRVCANS